jgi:hypothetical protein
MKPYKTKWKRCRGRIVNRRGSSVVSELPRVLKRSFLVLDVFYREKLLQAASITTQICFENLKLLNDNYIVQIYRIRVQFDTAWMSENKTHFASNCNMDYAHFHVRLDLVGLHVCAQFAYFGMQSEAFQKYHSFVKHQYCAIPNSQYDLCC